MNEPSGNTSVDARKVVTDFLRGRGNKARFVTEIFAALKKTGLTPEHIAATLGELEAEGTIMVRDHFCADPHLAGVDLRIAAIVENAHDAMPAIREIDGAWDKWLSSYLANHRCS